MEFTREEKQKRIRKIKRNRKIKNIVIFILIILFLVAVTGCVIMYLNLQKEKNKAVEAMNQKTSLEEELQAGGYLTKEEAQAKTEAAKKETSEEYLSTIRTMMENGDGTLTMLETLYPEKIVVPESGRYYFFDILDSLKKNDYANENFIFPILNEETCAKSSASMG